MFNNTTGDTGIIQIIDTTTGKLYWKVDYNGEVVYKMFDVIGEYEKSKEE